MIKIGIIKRHFRITVINNTSMLNSGSAIMCYFIVSVHYAII